MSFHNTTTHTTHTARKAHRCSGSFATIEPGEKYTRFTGVHPIVRPVRCCRCKRVMSEFDRISFPRKREKSVSDMVCPSCGCKTFFLVRADGKNCRSGDKQAETWPNDADQATASGKR